MCKATPRFRAELNAYRSGRLWLALGITVFTTGMTVATFSYLSPLLTDVAGLASEWVPAVLGLYGFGAVLDITVGGRLADVRPLSTLGSGISTSILALIVLNPGAHSTPIVLITIFILGFTGFITNSALNTRVFALADRAPTLAGASNVSAFNTGILLAPAFGAVTINAGLGYLSVTLVSIALGIGALIAIAFATRLRRSGTPHTETMVACP